MRKRVRLPEDRVSRIALVALAVLVGVGVVLRVLLMRAQTPGFVAVSDSAYYLIAAHTNVFVWAAEPATGNPWPAGYPAFLALVYAIDTRLSVIMIIQHAFGIGTALLWFATVRRVVSPLWALLPAAVVLLAGPQLFIEHMPMAEPLFALLIAGVAYCAVRALDGSLEIWGSLAGLLAAASACVRVIGLLLVAVVAVWLLLSVSGGLRRRLAASGAALIAAGLLLGGYLVEMKRETGFGGPALTRAGSWGAPAATAPGASRNYVERVGHDLTRYFGSVDHGAGGGYNYDGLIAIARPLITMDVLFQFQYITQGTRSGQVAWWYPTPTATANRGLLSDALRYERRTRLEGVPFALLLICVLAGIPLARGRRLWVGLLTGAIAAVTMVTPVLYLYFDARYVIPGYGPFAAVAAIGAASIWERVAARLRGRAEGRGKSYERQGRRSAGNPSRV